MNGNLFWSAMAKFFGGLVLVGLLLFPAAGSFAFWQGWLLMGILFVPMFLAGLVMMSKSPELLRRRLNAREEQTMFRIQLHEPIGGHQLSEHQRLSYGNEHPGAAHGG